MLKIVLIVCVYLAVIYQVRSITANNLSLQEYIDEEDTDDKLELQKKYEKKKCYKQVKIYTNTSEKFKGFETLPTQIDTRECIPSYKCHTKKKVAHIVKRNVSDTSNCWLQDTLAYYSAECECL